MSSKKKFRSTPTPRAKLSIRDTSTYPPRGGMDARAAFSPARTLGGDRDLWLAQDAALASAGVYDLITHSVDMGVWGGYPQFMGYGALQQISQCGLLRACIETVADDMTRAWIDIMHDDCNAQEAASKKDEICRELKRHRIKDLLHTACSLVGYEGGCMIFIDVGTSGPALADRLDKTGRGAELRRDGTLRFVVIDPVNCAPGSYNSTNPLAPDYFVPELWFVQGTCVHSSRLIRVMANEPLLLLRPAYNFFGIPQAQILWDYVAHFQKNRDAANRLLNKFSLTGLKTDMEATIHEAAGVESLDARMQLLARYRNNDGVLALDKEAEELIQINTPLSGVRELVQQSLEHLAALNRTPAVKLLGISPSGFNATGESDIRNYYDHIRSQQEAVLRPVIDEILSVLSIQLYGTPDHGLSFEFSSLSGADEAALATAQQQRTASVSTLVTSGIIGPEEARQYLRDSPDSGFDFLSVDDGVDNMPDDMSDETYGIENIDDIGDHGQ